MNSIIVTFSREIRAYFVSPSAYVVLACFLFIHGISFATLVGYLNDAPSSVGAPMEFFFGGTILFWLAMIFVGPILPMRLLSEERRSGGLEILMTAPVTEGQVVLGKYLASLAFYVVLWSPTLVYSLVLWAYSDAIDWGPIASAYLGIFAIGAMFLAVGMFASAVSRNQIVAAILAFSLIFGLLVIGLLEFLAVGELMREVIDYVNLIQHMDDFARGIVDTRRLVYYLSVAVFFLVLSSRTLALNKWR